MWTKSSIPVILLVTLYVVSSVTFAIVTYRDVLREEWNEYKTKFNKKYSDDNEDNYRFKIFLESKHLIAKHNQKFASGSVSYTIGLNQFADKTTDEYRKLLGYKPSAKPADQDDNNDMGEVRTHNRAFQGIFGQTLDTIFDLPKSIDWRQHGYVTPVKDQGHCGSCWAFSSTGALEGQHFRKTGNLISLSEQNLVDCSKKYGNMGCEGGLMANAFRYIRENHGVDTENSYPYEAHDDRCRFKNKTVGADDKGYVEIPSGDEKKLMQAIAIRGPVSVAIDASQDSFRLYTGGVYNEPNCGNSEENLDHGVLVVGYGFDPVHGDYYIVKNSWSELWGDAGYIKMARNKENQCGIATSAVYPVV